MSARGSLRQAVSDFVFEAASALSGKSSEEYAADVLYRSGGAGLGLQASEERASESHGEVSQRRTSQEASPWDLNADWEAFQATQRGEKR